jgi:cell shape-determining protein MreD
MLYVLESMPALTLQTSLYIQTVIIFLLNVGTEALIYVLNSLQQATSDPSLVVFEPLCNALLLSVSWICGFSSKVQNMAKMMRCLVLPAVLLPCCELCGEASRKFKDLRTD